MKELFILIPVIIFTLHAAARDGLHSAMSEDGVEIRYAVNGSGEPTLFLVHGWCNDRSVWDGQVDHFAQSHTVVTIDLPGSGNSGTNREQYTVNAYARDLIAVVEAVDPGQAVLAGFSMGAYVVVEAAGMIPDRVAGVVTVDEFQDVEAEMTPETIAFMDSLFMDVIANPSKEKLMGLGFFRMRQDASYSRVVDMLGRTDLDIWQRSLPDVLRWKGNASIPYLKSLQVPWVAINSAQIPTDAEKILKYQTNFRLHTMEDCGHLVMWDQKEVFNELLGQSILGFIGD